MILSLDRDDTSSRTNDKSLPLTTPNLKVPQTL